MAVDDVLQSFCDCKQLAPKLSDYWLVIFSSQTCWNHFGISAIFDCRDDGHDDDDDDATTADAMKLYGFVDELIAHP